MVGIEYFRFIVGGVVGAALNPPSDKDKHSDRDDYYGGDYGGGAGSMPG